MAEPAPDERRAFDDLSAAYKEVAVRGSHIVTASPKAAMSAR
jgi:hypothetical protein